MDFDLLPEYLSEVGEHLNGISTGLLHLEEFSEGDPRRSEVLQTLFRSFHTVKGLSAMVELTEFERLAHQCESVLHFDDMRHAALIGDAIDALIAATSEMSERIEVLGKGGREAAGGLQPFPDELTRSLDSLRRRLEESAAIDPDTSVLTRDEFPALPAWIHDRLSERDAALLREGRKLGKGLYLTEFFPTAESLAKGHTIATLMQRVGECGTLLRNIPSPLAEKQDGTSGTIGFALLFHSDLPAAALKDRLSATDLDIVTIESSASTEQSDATGIPQGEEGADRFAEAPRSAKTPPAREDDDSSVVIRIGLRKMDEIMRLNGELMITKARLVSGIQQLEASGSERELAYALSEDVQKLERGLRTLREAIFETRLVPIREAFQRLPLVLRDIMRGSERKCRLTFAGDHIELDRMIVERLVDPLIHFVRNAFDHGIEDPELRSRRGKAPEGTIAISATREGQHVRIAVRDDGAGIDAGKIHDRASMLGIALPPKEDFGMDDALRCLCLPGFSTREEASRISGRGVGMDVVAYNVASLNGILQLDSTPGEGSCFTMLIPITLSITEAMLVRVGTQTFAVPIGMVHETILLSPESISRIDRHRVTRFRESAVPTFSLQELYNLPDGFDWSGEKPALLINVGSGHVLVAIDAVVGKLEIVIKTLEDPLVRVSGVIGAAELGNGQIVLILDLPGILSKQTRERHGS